LREVNGRLEDAQAASEAMCLKFEGMENGLARKEHEEKKKRFESERALLKKVDECDIGLAKLNAQLTNLEDNIDRGGVGRVQSAVNEIRAVLEKHAEQANAASRRLGQMDRGHGDLRSQIEGLRKEMVEVRNRSTELTRENIELPDSLASFLPRLPPLDKDPLAAISGQRSNRRRSAAAEAVGRNDMISTNSLAVRVPPPVSLGERLSVKGPEQSADRFTVQEIRPPQLGCQPHEREHKRSMHGHHDPSTMDNDSVTANRQSLRKASGWQEAEGRPSRRLRPREL